MNTIRPSSKLQVEAAIVAALLVDLLSSTAHAQITAAPSTFAVTGAVESKLTLTVPAIKQQFATQLKTISYTLKGVAHTAEVVPLAAIVEAAHPKIDPHVKHAMLQDVVTVTGKDGYTVVFSWGELLPEIGNEPVWVALDQDGKPLPAEEGPVELIVPNDVKPARWVHSVASIEITAPLPQNL